MFIKEKGEELVRNIDGLVKYVECSLKSGYAYKILMDETVIDNFSKLKYEEEQLEKKKKSNKIWRERTKQNLLIFENFLNILHYI